VAGVGAGPYYDLLYEKRSWRRRPDELATIDFVLSIKNRAIKASRKGYFEKHHCPDTMEIATPSRVRGTKKKSNTRKFLLLISII